MYRFLRLVRDQTDVNRNVASTCIGSQCDIDLIRAFSDDGCVVNRDVLTFVGGQKRRQ